MGKSGEGPVPDDFGELNGTAIKNKDSILNEIDVILGKKKHPAVEYIITRPYGLITLPFGLGSINYNTWGHSALRYTTPDGKDVVANVEAKTKGKSFIQFFDAKEYLYGVDPNSCGSQKATYHRDMIGFRVENVDPKDIEKMHNYILDLIEKDGKMEVQFNIIAGPIFNMLKLWLPWMPEYGNCARWTSAMLLQAGLVTKICVWPTTVFINMFENYEDTNVKELSNMHVVYYEQPPHVKKLAYGVRAKPVWFEHTVAPLQTFRNYFYGDLTSFAHCVVSVPVGTTTAHTYIRAKPTQPSKLRNLFNSKYSICVSVVGSVIFYRRGFGRLKQFINNRRAGVSYL
jgi:hypothetical protein